MEPSIQYARSVDGVNIAYWTHGDGYPIIQTPSGIGLPTRRAWQIEAGRRWYDGLGRGRRLVRFDNRGFGESQRDVTSFPQDFEILDLETVVDHLGLDRFALFAYVFYGPAAIAYAARHPERVSHLILWCTSPRDFDMGLPPALEALRSADWDLYLQNMALLVFGWADPVQAAQYAQALRDSMSPESVEALSRLPEHDVTSLLPSITAPTLVLHRRGVRSSPNVPRELAAAI